MRKIYSMVAFAAMSLMSLTANAQYEVPAENPVLQSEAYNYRLYKDVNFAGLTINGNPIEEGTISFNGASTTEIKFNGYDPYRCSTEGLENLWCAVATPNYTADRGIVTNGSGPRGLLLSGMKTGQIIVLQGRNGGYNTGETDAEYNGFCVPNGSRYNANTGWVWELFDPLQVEDISPEIHAAQDAAALEAGEITEEETAHDTYLYLRVLNDGWVSIPMERAASIGGYQIWIDAAAAEAVTTPQLKVVGVNHDARNIEFKPGESTFGATVATYYSIDGSDPIFLKDTDEVDHWEYVYETDEEGNQVVTDSTAVYKKVLDRDLVEEIGDYGDNLFNPEDGSIYVNASEDEDGDGIITVKAASVSVESGAISDVVSIDVPVGEITLNAPGFAWTGISGTDRIYKITWVNNTICGEDYNFTVETGEGAYFELTSAEISTFTVPSATWVKATVKVEGYLDGEAVKEVDVPNLSINRKSDKAHDWDFVHPTDEQKAIIRGEVIESCYIIAENGDSLVYSAEEYENGISNDGKDLSGATPNYAPSCWWWDGGNLRATLNVNSDTIVDASLLHDLNANGYGYVEDKAGIFDGLELSCPPNASNNSCIFQYIGKGDWADGGYEGDGITELGVYLMAAGTFTFPREVAKAGELVAIYTGTGGSNYTNTRTLTIYEVPTTEPLSVRVSSATHVFYIDVYTYDNLPEDEYDPTGIEAPVAPAAKAISGIYSINGARLAAPQKGINIVKYSDGSVKKILVK